MRPTHPYGQHWTQPLNRYTVNRETMIGMFTDSPQLLGVGIYGVTEAARLTGVSPACIRRWLRGYSYNSTGGQREIMPVFTRQLPPIENELALGFLDLIEVKIVNSLLVDLADNQMTFRKMVEPHLKDIDFDTHQRATRWWPMGVQHNVLLDPARSFGQPIVREGVPTNVLAKAFNREPSESTIARWYEVDPRAVRDAVKVERNLAA